jgi:hypothetical protein
MRIVLASLALGVGFALAAPVQAADSIATDKPVQLVQQPTHKDTDKDKHAKDKDKEKQEKKDVRSNKGGAERGDARSDQVKGMAKGKPQ